MECRMDIDFENANCKRHLSQQSEYLPLEKPLKVSREITCLQDLIYELHQAFSTDYVNVDYVSQLMLSYKSNRKDWKKFAKFDRFRYTRNLVDAGNGAFNIMVICWGNGHGSAIHDHADSHCFMKMLSGELEEIRYTWPDKKSESKVCKCTKTIDENHNSDTTSTEQECEICCSRTQSDVPCKKAGGGPDITTYDEVEYPGNGGMEELGRTRLELNDVCYINDSIGLHRVENPSHTDGAVSLHLYCPPFDACSIFDARTGKPMRVPVTFWSVNGEKRNRIIQEQRMPEDN